jgi:hypothetical protein
MRRVNWFACFAWCGILLVSACTSNARSSSSTSSTSASTSSTSTTSKPTTTGATTTSSSAPAGVPEVVNVVAAGPGGGSGEVVVRWNAVPAATGYQVVRALTATSSFETMADFNTFTGFVTAGPGVVNLWSTGYTYVPPGTAGSLPDRSPAFEYVEVRGAGDRCFRVIAYNAAGSAPASKTVCSPPP